MNIDITTITTPSLFSGLGNNAEPVTIKDGNLLNTNLTRPAQLTVEYVQAVIDACNITNNSFWLEMLIDFRSALLKKRTLSEKQFGCVIKAATQCNNRISAPAAATKQADVCTERLSAGRYNFTVTVLSVKWQESEYGSTLKMLGITDKGYKVWGSVPAGIQNDITRVEDGCTVVTPFATYIKGKQVSLTATVAPKGNEDFAFFSRPCNAQVIG